MKVYVTPVDIHPVEGHPVPHYDRGEPFEGSHLVVTRDAVIVDGEVVIRRDRRAKVSRTPGHPWLTAGNVFWTGFSVEVEANIKGGSKS